MASSTAKPQKTLEQFLKDQQEPFILQDYLLERRCSKKWSYSSADSGNTLDKSLLPFSKLLIALYKRLSFQNASCITRESNIRNEDIISVPETGRIDQIVVETDRFSSASNSTLFNSCSEIDEEETWISSHKDHPSFSSDSGLASNVCHVGIQSQQATNNGKHGWRCIENSPVSLSQYDVIVNQDVRGMEKRIPSCSVLRPKKITKDSLSSGPLWGLLIQWAKKESCTRESNVSQIWKSKRVLQKTKELLFDCVREIAVTLPRKDKGEQEYKRSSGKLICKGTKDWGKQARDETNLPYLFTLDYLNSIYQWGDFEAHVKDISVQIADSILGRINNEIVSEIIEKNGENEI